MEKRHFDLIIIGGGINGVAIAEQASKLGKQVVLFEKTELGAGASSHTSKLAHGGLRYLESFEFGLVRESLEERDLLIKTYPDLVKPLPFIFPVYKASKRPLWQVKLGMTVYDFYSRKGPLPRHRSFTASQLASLAPDLKRTGLKGGVVYYDAQMDDLGLVLRLADIAKAHGATIIEHCPVSGFLYHNQRISGVKVIQDGETVEYQAPDIVNVSGPWSNDILHMDSATPTLAVGPTKGIHLIVPRFTADHAFILQAPQDHRIFFVMPYGQHTLIGTTDTVYQGDPDNVSVLPEDIDYLLDAASFYFPEFTLMSSQVISTYCGLRPLVAATKKNASAISRDFVVSQSESGLWTMLGGKYTTHRLMAERLLTQIGYC